MAGAARGLESATTGADVLAFAPRRALILDRTCLTRPLLRRAWITDARSCKNRCNIPYSAFSPIDRFLQKGR